MAMNSIKMEPGSTPPVDGNEYKEYLMTLSIPELISNLQTAFRPVDFDRVVEVLAENETKLKYEIKALTEKLELETLVRMSAEEECKGRKNAERYKREILENTLSELRIKNVELEEEKCLAELAAKFWKSKFEELSERLLMVKKGVNSFMNGDALVGIGGKAEDLSNIRGNTHLGVSDEGMDEKDMNVNDICDNEQGNTTAGSFPSQREHLKSGNTHVSTAEVSRQSPDSPNEALLGASENLFHHTMRAKNPQMHLDSSTSPSSTDHESSASSLSASPSTPTKRPRREKETPKHYCPKVVKDVEPPQKPRTKGIVIQEPPQNPHQTWSKSNATLENGKEKVSDANMIEKTPGMSGQLVSTRASTIPSLLAISFSQVPPQGISTKDMDKQEDNEVDMDDHECGNITAHDSPSQTNSDDCGNTHLAVDDDNRQSPDTPNTARPGASANASLGSQEVVVEILDSDDDECIVSGTLNGKEASCDIAPAVSASGLFESLKRKWFPEGGNSFDRLNKNLVDASDTDDDSSSSISFSELGINKGENRRQAKHSLGVKLFAELYF